METFERNPEKIRQLIEDLKRQGYDRIHLPGGTSKDESHYSGDVIPHYDKETKDFFFVGVPYNSTFYKQGGDNGHTKKMNETPEETAIREALEETGLQIQAKDMKNILSYNVPDKKRPGKFHQKNFYLINNFSGNLFTFEGPNPIDGETAAPILIPTKLFKEVLFGGHQKALTRAAEELCSISLEYYDALCGLVEG